jgi:hypothetical protein
VLPGPRRPPYRLREDAEGRVFVPATWVPTAVGAGAVALLALVAALLAARGFSGVRPHLRMYAPMAVVATGTALALALKALHSRRTRIVFDGRRAEVQVLAGNAARVVPFTEVRGLRLSVIGRGFQSLVELVTTSGETVELMTTGIPEDAKGLAAGLSSRFGFAPIVD